MPKINYNHLPKQTEYSKVILQDFKNIKKTMEEYGNAMVGIFGEVKPCRICTVPNSHKIAYMKDLGWVLLGHEKTLIKDNKKYRGYTVSNYSFYVGVDDNYIYWQKEIESLSLNNCYYMKYVKERIHNQS